MEKRVDISGLRFGRLVAREYVGDGKWLCECDCGNECYVKGSYLRRGDTKSCGCLYREGRSVPQVDLTGRRFGKLTVVSYAGSSYWDCKCECGRETTVLGARLLDGQTKSCGCLRHVPYSLNDLTGMRFGKLVVRDYMGGSKWLCDCDCGRETVVATHALSSGGTKSCGCLAHEKTVARNTTHGESGTRLYRVYRGMINRCYNANTDAYASYGGRGIKICDEWLSDFLAFKKWAYASGYDPDAPRGKCTINRIDNDGDYCPDNCEWTDSKSQRANQRQRRNDPRPDCRRFRPVESIDDEGNVVQRYQCIRDAAIDSGCCASSITNVCRGKQKTANGMRWRYAIAEHS